MFIKKIIIIKNIEEVNGKKKINIEEV